MLILAFLTLLADATPIMVRVNGRINTGEFAGYIVGAIGILCFSHVQPRALDMQQGSIYTLYKI